MVVAIGRWSLTQVWLYLTFVTCVGPLDLLFEIAFAIAIIKSLILLEF